MSSVGEEGHVRRQGASYRQGLVLGLTMAEILLLLVFCLLIATGALLAQDRAERKELEKRLAQAEISSAAAQEIQAMLAENPHLRQALESSKKGGTPAAIDQYWRELVESEAIVQALEKAGIDRAEAFEAAQQMVEAVKARRSGVDVATAVGDVNLVKQIRKRIQGGKQASDETILAVVDNGLSAGPDEGGHRWPPMIKLSEADGYFFASGRADLTLQFEDTLRSSVIESLLVLAQQYNCDVIEVVGHTDELPVGNRASNLDASLSDVLADRASVTTLVPSDNAGLGLARAAAVVRVLKSDQRLHDYKILPLSGAQLILTDESLSNGTSFGDVKERRRIEIRLRKSVPADALAAFGSQ